jgi:hypothetical protein
MSRTVPREAPKGWPYDERRIQGYGAGQRLPGSGVAT